MYKSSIHTRLLLSNNIWCYRRRLYELGSGIVHARVLSVLKEGFAYKISYLRKIPSKALSEASFTIGKSPPKVLGNSEEGWVRNTTFF